MPEDARAEVIAGAVVTPPSPLPRHARAQRSLGRFVGGPFDDDDGRGGPGGWWILIEVDVRLRPQVTKRDLYAQAGVPYYWLVDPDARTLEALRLDLATRAWVELGAYNDAALARIAPFEAIELEVGRLFPPAEDEAPR